MLNIYLLEFLVSIEGKSKYISLFKIFLSVAMSFTKTNSSPFLAYS
mgnify:CR=1 FL=1